MIGMVEREKKMDLFVWKKKMDLFLDFREIGPRPAYGRFLGVVHLTNQLFGGWGSFGIENYPIVFLTMDNQICMVLGRVENERERSEKREKHVFFFEKKTLKVILKSKSEPGFELYAKKNGLEQFFQVTYLT